MRAGSIGIIRWKTHIPLFDHIYFSVSIFLPRWATLHKSMGCSSWLSGLRVSWERVSARAGGCVSRASSPPSSLSPLLTRGVVTCAEAARRSLGRRSLGPLICPPVIVGRYLSAEATRSRSRATSTRAPGPQCGSRTRPWVLASTRPRWTCCEWCST